MEAADLYRLQRRNAPPPGALFALGD